MIYLAADHGGFNLKNKLVRLLEQSGYQIRDLGPDQFDPTDDYPDFADLAVTNIKSDQDQAILICRTGHGMAIAANRHPSIRAILAHTPQSAIRARQDEDANVLVLAADFIDEAQAESIVKAWLDTPFSQAERHVRRIKKIS